MSEKERQRALDLARRKLHDITEPLQANEPQLARALLATDALLTETRERAIPPHWADVFNRGEQTEAALTASQEEARVLREALRWVVETSATRWLSVGSIDNVAEIRVSREKFKAARAALDASRSSTTGSELVS